MKTGFICDSGFNVVASATRDGRKLMAIVLGEPTGHDRSVRAANLLEHGFQTHAWKALFEAPNITTLPIAEDAKGVMTMRQAVISYVCGTGRRRAVAKKRRPKPGQPVAAKATKQRKTSTQKAAASQ
jgi:D-alanyl-D-alanine carboxypeptidase